MPTWHQQKAGIPKLSHPTKWRSYNPSGHLSVMTHAGEKECRAFCERTGDIPLAPDSHYARLEAASQSKPGQAHAVSDEPSATEQIAAPRSTP